MVKIMLVEDDKSLREIYGARLLAEGYDIVSAGDGEEALAIAIKEKPGLIISDVMMPKISGFDMLDILRSSSETRNTKVIMMTALSSDDQRQRGEQLGADRYLVKSQVGIEDVVRVVHEVLEDAGSAESPVTTAVPAQSQAAPAAPAAPPQPAASEPEPPAPEQPPAQPAPVAPPPQPRATEPEAPEPTPEAPNKGTSNTPAPSGRNRTIQPINDPHQNSVDINELLDKELAKEVGVDANGLPTVASTEQERNLVDSQIDQFANSPATPDTAETATSAEQQEETPAEPAPTETSEQPEPATTDEQTPPPVASSQPSSDQPTSPPPRPPVAL